MSLLLVLLLTFAVAYLAAMLAGNGPKWLQRINEARATARAERQQREADARASELLRERIIGGANILEMLDRSNVDREEVAA